MSQGQLINETSFVSCNVHVYFHKKSLRQNYFNKPAVSKKKYFMLKKPKWKAKSNNPSSGYYEKKIKTVNW